MSKDEKKQTLEQKQCRRMRTLVRGIMDERKLTRAKLVRNNLCSRRDFDRWWQPASVNDEVILFWSTLLGVKAPELYEATIFSE